ncbi:MAG: hypothetical protein NTY19_06850, partial [Planctomycetota bacterium]|nr:hypothetical protein [Planctomycetota bacterium]
IAKGFVSWTDSELMALTRSAGKNWSKMAHELTHVLEYVGNPILLEKEAMTWWRIMGAEYRAFLVQTGSRMMGGGGSFLTLFANTFDYAGVLLPLRELIYWEASNYGWTG